MDIAARAQPARDYHAGMRIIVLGGYGHFGGRICHTLAADGRFEVHVAGRDEARARAFIAASGDRAGAMRPLRLDAGAAGLTARLAALAPDLVIHTAGPFQGAGYGVARAALAAGAHYVDLADARDHVAGFAAALDAPARAAGRLAVGGASSVPGLSGAVVQAHLHRFASLQSLDIGISPGNRTPRGLATTEAILGYVGRPFPLRREGGWRRAHGWQSLRRERYPGVGVRWLARCDVPDLAVLPARHPGLRDCDFRAGLELRRMHFGLWLASWAVRAGVVRRLPAWAGPLLRLSGRWLDEGSDVGVMHVDMRGTGVGDGHPLALRWLLVARGGDGPQIPCTAAIVLARMLAEGRLADTGARACLDLFTLDDYLDALRGFDIQATLLGPDPARRRVVR
ncbi:saccharopine dehydrogenase family protein [Pseudoxanthomonas sp. 10H]|uniref:saccharopine dehydrogenase family protein n=1 Tax=Pseudoxanthomonas sp. 10H TaxID=3242729 RepID=UPI0035576CCC